MTNGAPPPGRQGAPDPTRSDGSGAEAAADVRAKAAHGAGWTIALGTAARGLGLVGSVAITHFLHPAVMGEVAAAVVVVLTVNQFSTWGTGQYLIAHPREGRDVVFHATVLHVGIGAAALALTALLAHPLAAWLHAPSLPRYLAWLAFAVFLDRVAYVPERVLTRTLQFKRLAVARASSEIAYTALALGLAWAGAGGMAIVLANVARFGVKLVGCAGSIAPSAWLSPHRLSLATYRRIFAFGGPLAVAAYAGFAASRWDNLVIERLFGPALMGQYNSAYNLADVPADQIGEQVAEVLLPSLATLPRAERPHMALSAAGIVALVVFPVSVGLGAVAPTLGATILGRDWTEVGRMMSWLSALSLARPLSWQAAAYLTANGQPRTVLVLEVGKLALVLALLLTLGRLGPLWACAAIGIAFASHTVAAHLTLARTEAGFTFRAWLGRIAPPALACAPLLLAVLGVRRALAAAGVGPGVLGLASEVVAGALVYVGAALVIAPAHARELIETVRDVRRRRAGVAARP